MKDNMRKVYDIISSIQDSKTIDVLSTHFSSLGEFRVAISVFQDLYDKGSSKMFVGSVAEFYKKHGFKVSISSDYVNFIIES
jgi:hypothetical protein